MAPCIRVVWSSRCIQGRRDYVPRPESGFGAAYDRLFRMSLCYVWQSSMPGFSLKLGA